MIMLIALLISLIDIREVNSNLPWVRKLNSLKMVKGFGGDLSFGV